MAAGTATVLRADARALPLPDASVDLIVTSPPYFGLRSYTDGGEHYAGQIGAEATPAEYIASLIDCTREWMRVLKPSGSMWINLGDKYAGAPSGPTGATSGIGVERGGRNQHDVTAIRQRRTVGIPAKSLMLLPERYRIACVDQLGLIARAVVIWFKPNGLPESVTDRVRRSHEDWVHLVKQSRYYAAVDEIREPSDARNLRPADTRGAVSAKDLARRESGHGTIGHVGKPLAFNPLGKLPGSVWEIATEPLTVPDHLGIDHFAAFPTEWPRRLILGWSPSGICTACGEGRRPVLQRGQVDPDLLARRGGHSDASLAYSLAVHTPRGDQTKRGIGLNISGKERQAHRSPDLITGEQCACPDTSAPTRPAVIVDPFGGTGTTALVAKALGRHGISVDRSADYCRLAAWRTTDPGQLAKAMRVPKPPAQTAGQLEMFDLGGPP